MKKVISILLASVIALGLLMPMSLAADSRNFKITNPYATVDWSSWTAYKANRHTHSTYSDASIDLATMVEEYYRLGYDVLAMTDHGVINRGWNKAPEIIPILNLPTVGMPKTTLTDERYQQMITGSDRGGKPMLDVPKGIELNAGVLEKNHVNGYFVEYGQGDWGKENDFETPIAGVAKLGGLSQINHPGDWLGSAKDVNIAKDPKWIRMFGDLLIKYPSCMGIEVLNQNDSPTRHDRVLWDGLLEYVIPAGRNVLGLGTSDAHTLGHVGSSYEYIMMPSNTVENLRTAMENGTIFAVGKYARTAMELGDGFVGDPNIEPPMVTNVVVNEAAQTISLTPDANTTSVEWIAKGEVIATGNTINLQDYTDEIGCYVRAQLKGPGGICFTQAFVCDDGDMQQTLNDNRTALQKFLDGIWAKMIQNRIIAILRYAYEKLVK